MLYGYFFLLKNDYIYGKVRANANSYIEGDESKQKGRYFKVISENKTKERWMLKGGWRWWKVRGVVLTQFRHEIKGLHVVFAEKVPVFPRVQIKFSLQFPRDRPLDKIPVPYLIQFLSLCLFFSVKIIIIINT